MVGGGSRKDESLSLNSNNVFAALGSLRRKKKSSDKDHASSKKKATAASAPAKEVYWAPAPLTVKSWADVDEEDDDDYYQTTAPPIVWATTDSKVTKETPEPVVEETESEEESADEVEDEVEDDHDHTADAPVETEQPVVKNLKEAPLVPKDTDRQLSKKELKKKELEELEAVLVELGIQQESSTQGDSHGTSQAVKIDTGKEPEKKDNTTVESKASKKKKKKDKSLKETKESQTEPEGDAGGSVANGNSENEKAEDSSPVDVKDRLKKLALSKKKKSSKEMDAASRAAASEAAARSARLAAAKKKEKNHYNQQPGR